MRLSVCSSVHWKLTSLWLVALESSSGYGLVTPMATQLAKMASRMKISKGLRTAVKARTGLCVNSWTEKKHNTARCTSEDTAVCRFQGSSSRTLTQQHAWCSDHTKGYFHSTRASAAMRMGLLRVRQHRARGARRADLLACIAFLAPPPLFLVEPVDPRVSDFPPSPPGGASF